MKDIPTDKTPYVWVNNRYVSNVPHYKSLNAATMRLT